MADFRLPEYGSYVQLCRELRPDAGRINGGARFGDQFFNESRNEVVLFNRQVWDESSAWGESFVWLPALSDWLPLLVKELEDPKWTRRGYRARLEDRNRWMYLMVEIAPLSGGWTCSPAIPVRRRARSDDEGFRIGEDAATPEEAAGRLWSALEGDKASQSVTPDLAGGKR